MRGWLGSSEHAPGEVGGRAGAVLLALAVSSALVLVGSCREGPGSLPEMGSSNLPFERIPYVQAVDSSSARILWRVAEGVRDSFRYRIEGSEEWREVSVEQVGEPIERSATPGSLPLVAIDRLVRLEGLPPDTRIQYAVSTDSLELGPFSFRTAPRPGGSDTVRVLAFGDSGWGSEGQVRLAERMETYEWDLAVHAGDIAYQSGTDRDFTLRHFQVYQRLLASVPFFPSPGDHDLRTDGGAPYDRAFHWPAPADGARFYSFRWGDVMFIALETGDESPAGLQLRRGTGEQLAWLEQTLASVSADPTVEWTVVFMHAPPYSHASGFGGHGSDLRVRRVLSPLFDRYGVDLVLTGHDHHYERTHPIRDEERVPPGCGPVYVVTGGGGASRYARGTAPSILSAAGSREYQFVRLQISDRSIDAEAINPDGRSVDSFGVTEYPGLEQGLGARCS